MGAERCCGAHAEATRGTTVPVACGLFRHLDAGKHVEAVGKKGLAHFRQALPAGGAMDQLRAETLFQFLDVARLFVGEGAHVFICDVLEDEGQALVNQIGAGGKADFTRLNVADADD